MNDTPAAKAGLQIGDRITRIGDMQNPTWEQIEQEDEMSPGQPLVVDVERDGQTLEKTVVPEATGVDGIGYAGWTPKEATVTITDVQEKMPAEKAGLKEGDKILALDGKPVPALGAMVESLENTKDKPITLTVLRDGQEKTFTIQPVLARQNPLSHRHLDHADEGQDSALCGGLEQVAGREPEQRPAHPETGQEDGAAQDAAASIEGPIRIGQAAGEAARSKGWTPLMGLTAAISLNLGIFNLLPIPILDGGVILFLLIEGLMRRDISMNIKERVYQAAFVFLVLFAAMVIFNDLLKVSGAGG